MPGPSADEEFLQRCAGARRHEAGDIAPGRGKFGPQGPAVLPEGGVPPAGVPTGAPTDAPTDAPWAQTFPGRQLVLDPVAGPGFGAAGFGARNGASGKNECGRQEQISKDMIFHRYRPGSVGSPRGQANPHGL